MDYYNEHDAFAAKWLRELIRAGLIPPGEVDERDIQEVSADDVRGFRQCHFFAGIGGWSYALQLAGWPTTQPVWTGSCPCQPFSQAGKRKAEADERHLWPEFFRLIAQCKPAVVFGEQVASEDGRIWLAGVQADLEMVAYAFGAADLCAAGVSAPQKRQRLYWVGESDRTGLLSWNQAAATVGHWDSANTTSRLDTPGLVNADGYHEHWWSGPVQVGWNGIEAEIERGGRKYRAQWRIKPGLSIVAHGVSNRVGKLCGFGNAIVPQVAAEFIKAYLEAHQ